MVLYETITCYPTLGSSEIFEPKSGDKKPVSYRSMTSRFPPFAFVELVSPYNKKNITRWLEDVNFMFSWQKQYLTHSLRSRLRYCSCHSNIKVISSRHRVISYIYHAKTEFDNCFSIHFSHNSPSETEAKRSAILLLRRTLQGT